LSSLVPVSCGMSSVMTAEPYSCYCFRHSCWVVAQVFASASLAYRQLPNDARASWNKHKPPAIYHLTRTSDVLQGLGKDPGTNTTRW
jgi:hypothetical protein